MPEHIFTIVGRTYNPYVVLEDSCCAAPLSLHSPFYQHLCSLLRLPIACWASWDIPVTAKPSIPAHVRNLGSFQGLASRISRSPPRIQKYSNGSIKGTRCCIRSGISKQNAPSAGA